MGEKTTGDDGTLRFGTEVYDEDGNRLGQVQGFEPEGFYVAVGGNVEVPEAAYVRTAADVPDREVLWRCQECGEMGTLDPELPASCPDCGAPRECLYHYLED
ncbi:MAG: hypothetical protein V5A23_03540 [Halobacteriales archaeon]